MSLDELKHPKNNLFKVTCRDRHDSPNYTFTWELTPEGSRILQEKKVRFPFVYILVVEEFPPDKIEGHREGCGCNSCGGCHKVVEEELFCLHEGAGLVQLHHQGTFKIFVTVVWYPDDMVDTHTWRHHRSRVRGSFRDYRERILDGSNTLHIWSLNHVEEDAVCIADGFFAKMKPNPTLWWWANLWWENKPRNTCEYKNRLMFAPGLLVMVPTVSIYAFIRGLLIGFSYISLLLVGFRPSSFSFYPMFHAFSSMFKQLCDFESKTCNYAFQNANGRDRDKILSIAIRIPIVWIVAPILLSYWGSSIYHHPKMWMWAVIILASIAGGGFGLFYLVEKLKSRMKSVVLYYEQVPIEKPKNPRVPIKVRWLDAKGKLCLPFPE